MSKLKKFEAHATIFIQVSLTVEALDEEDAMDQCNGFDVPSWLDCGFVASEEVEIDSVHELKIKKAKA